MRVQLESLAAVEREREREREREYLYKIGK